MKLLLLVTPGHRHFWLCTRKMYRKGIIAEQIYLIATPNVPQSNPLLGPLKPKIAEFSPHLANLICKESGAVWAFEDGFKFRNSTKFFVSFS